MKSPATHSRAPSFEVFCRRLEWSLLVRGLLHRVSGYCSARCLVMRSREVRGAYHGVLVTATGSGTRTNGETRRKLPCGTGTLLEWPRAHAQRSLAPLRHVSSSCGPRAAQIHTPRGPRRRARERREDLRPAAGTQLPGRSSRAHAFWIVPSFRSAQMNPGNLGLGARASSWVERH